MKFTVDEFLGKLPLPANDKWKEGVFDIEPFAKAGVKLVFFAPRGTDHQTSHDEDEFYFIVRGSGEIVIAGERQSFEAGDVFFVEKGIEHRFADFTGDLVTWAIFF
jgi:mannose-6-phosphate isomerase-like protein (cupin superfamily)